MQKHLHVAAAIFAAFYFSAPARAQVPPPDGPTLKGTYVLADTVMCTPGKGQSFTMITGLATFDPATHKLKLDGYSAGGDPVTLNHVKQTLTYANSATTVTFGDTVYQASYGGTKNGIAIYLSLITGVDPCGAQVTLSRQ